MKGLLLKDYYLIKSALYIILTVFVVIGVAMSFLTSTWVLTVIATVLLGMISVTTITMDKASGWRKFSCVLPVSKKTVIDSKYILYLLLSGIGFLLGIILSITVSALKNQLDHNTMFIFISISIALALFSGSITLPCTFLFSEDISVLSLIIAYPLSSVVFVGAALFFDNRLVACGVVFLLGAVFYMFSWYIARTHIAYKEAL